MTVVFDSTEGVRPPGRNDRCPGCGHGHEPGRPWQATLASEQPEPWHPLLGSKWDYWHSKCRRKYERERVKARAAEHRRDPRRLAYQHQQREKRREEWRTGSIKDRVAITVGWAIAAGGVALVAAWAFVALRAVLSGLFS